jgi:hypothetical protein
MQPEPLAPCMLGADQHVAGTLCADDSLDVADCKVHMFVSAAAVVMSHDELHTHDPP